MPWLVKVLKNNEEMPEQYRGKVFGHWGTPMDSVTKATLVQANEYGRNWGDTKPKLSEKRYGMSSLCYYIWSDEPERNEWGEVSP